MRQGSTRQFDFVLVGGGLQNGLLALALADQQPGARVALIERAERLGGNHTWSWHEGDVPQGAEPLVEGLIDHRWPRYRVLFPGLERAIRQDYACTSGETLSRVVGERLARTTSFEIRCGESAVDVRGGYVALHSGDVLRASLVIDARGPERGMPCDAGYQKFVGLEVELERPVHWDDPLLMDARVPQVDGFRFVYVLPFAPNRLLVEDTYYSDTPRLDVEEIAGRIQRYCRAQEWTVRTIHRREHGVLPLPFGVPPLRDEPGLLVGGYAGGWFHPTTGYSFPVALRIARWIARMRPDTVGRTELRTMSAKLRRQQRFCVWLNRLLFKACNPEDRWQVLRRFYGLPAGTIERFYSLEMSAVDRLRIVCGRPPPGIHLRRFFEEGAPAWHS